MAGTLPHRRKFRKSLSHSCMFTLLMMTTDDGRGATVKKWLKLLRSFRQCSIIISVS